MSVIYIGKHEGFAGDCIKCNREVKSNINDNILILNNSSTFDVGVIGPTCITKKTTVLPESF